MTVKTTAPASEKQLAFIAKLVSEKDTSHFGEDTLTDLQTFKSGGDLPKKFASQLIDALLSAPKKAVEVKSSAGTPAALTPGIYGAPNGDVIKVKKTKDGQRVYAQVMVAKGGQTRINLHDEEVPNFDFVYVPGLIVHLTPQMKLTLEDAKAFYTRTGRCLNCKKELKVAASIEKGLGPVCAKMFA
jgi:hypothetical protein